MIRITVYYYLSKYIYKNESSCRENINWNVKVKLNNFIFNCNDAHVHH